MLRTLSILFTLIAFPICSHAAMILKFDSSPSSWVGQGESRYVTPADGYTFDVTTNFDNGLSFSIERDGLSHGSPLHDHWRLELSAPFDALLTVGLYEGATRWPFQNIEDPGLTFSGNHRGNNKNIGFFKVLEAVYSPSGEIESFAVDFTQYGEQNPDWWIHGSLRYNSDVDVIPLPAAMWLFLSGLVALSRIRKGGQSKL